jgi:hypothetical protein
VRGDERVTTVIIIIIFIFIFEPKFSKSLTLVMIEKQAKNKPDG